MFTRRTVLYLSFWILTFIFAYGATSAIPNFDVNRGGAVEFNGSANNFLSAANTKQLNPGVGDFTISWWQSTPNVQSYFPRIIQFGEGSGFSDKFAISQENDGNIYLWINGSNITSISTPLSPSWHHIAIVRSGSTFRWFKDGIFIKSDVSDQTFNTSSLPLFIGGGNDSVTRSLIGKVAGLQIASSVRWAGTQSFTPPTNFFTPDSNLGFSMYVEEIDILDKSSNPMTIQANSPTARVSFTPTAEPSASPSPTADPSASPSPTAAPSASPSPTSSASPDCHNFHFPATVDGQTVTWGQSITISKPSDTPVECSFANLQLLLLEISFQDPEPNPELRVPNPFCLMQMTDWVRPADSFTSISIPSDGLISFAQFTEFFNLGCGLIVGNDDFLADEPNEDQFKFEYNPGLFGSRNRVNVSARFRFFNVDYFEDFDEMPIPILFDTRLENFGPAEFTLRLPPEILESSINSNSDPDFKEVKWGDSITVSTNGTSETKKVLMWIRLPELDQWCWHTLVDVDDLDSELASEKTYVVPSREFFQDHCNSQINPANGLQINPELDRYVTIQYLNIYDQGQETSFILEGVSTPTPSPVLEPAPTPQTVQIRSDSRACANCRATTRSIFANCHTTANTPC